MSPAAEVRHLLAELRRTSRSRRVLLPVPLVGTVLLLVVAGLAGAGTHPVLAVPSLLLAVVATVAPGGSAPLFLLAYLAGYWALTVPETLGGWVPVAAALLAAIHVAGTVSAYGPAGLQVPPPLLRRWGARMLVMVVAAGAVWLAARAFPTVGPGDPTLAVLVGLAVVAGWVVLLLARLGVGDDADR